MKRSAPLPRKRATARRKPAIVCGSARCKRRPSPGSSLCVSHTEQRADRLFSVWVRKRDGGCTYVLEKHIDGRDGPCGVTTALQAAHVIGRRNKAVRFDPENVHALCSAHHVMVDQHGREGAKFDWAIAVLGPGRFGALRERARTPKDRATAALEALEWLEAADG